MDYQIVSGIPKEDRLDMSIRTRLFSTNATEAAWHARVDRQASEDIETEMKSEEGP